MTTATKRPNPFERFDLDPCAGPETITERLRELAADADASQRAEIRAAWEELTLHPLRRLRAAFGAHPETRPPLGAPPPRGAEREGSAAASTREPPSLATLTLAELALLPCVEGALVHDPRSPRLPPAPPLSEDPILSAQQGEHDVH